MTTPANHGSNSGANQPEDDDPFGYLYADGQAAGATPPAPGGGYGYPGPTVGGQPGVQPGVPRTSYNQVRTVGERTYGGQRGAQVPPQQQPPAYQAQYQAPEALQAGGYGVPPQQGQATASIPAPGGHGGHGGGGGSSRKGMLIAAVAVVAAVAIGIGAAVAFGDKDKDKNGKGNTAGGQQSAQPQNSPSTQPSPSDSPQAPLPKADASGAGMSLTGGAHLEAAIPGAKSAGGQYVGGFNTPGAALTWTVDVPAAGDYTLFVNYGVPGKDAKATLTVNGQSPNQSLNLANFAKAEAGAWDKGWQRTYAWITLKKGTNTMKISCEPGNQCEAVFDQLDLGQGHIKR